MFTINDIVEAVGGQLIQGPEKVSVKSVCIDSRNVQKDEVFIAIKGDIFDGHDFITEVVARGVRVIVLHKLVAVKNSHVSVIQVKDTTAALGHLARFHRLRSKAAVIALTGSTGKTTTKEMITCVLEKRYRVLKSEGTQNNHIGVPLTLLKIKPNHQMVVVECGTNQPGDIPWLADIVRPNVAVFTNIGSSHLQKLKTPQGVLKEKWKLTSYLGPKGAVVVNADDPLLATQVKTIKNLSVLTYGIHKNCRYRATEVNVKDGLSVNFKIQKKSFSLNTCSTNSIYNALAAYACGCFFSVSIDKIAAALNSFAFPKGRGQIVKLGSGWMINDSYNANPVSMLNAIQMLNVLKTQGKRIMIAADMLELGTKAKDLHGDIGGSIARSRIDVLITIGALSRHMAARARKDNKQMSVFACADVESAQKHLIKVLTNGDSILIKGSRRMATERIVNFLLMSPKENA